MKTSLVLAALVGFAFGAPAENISSEKTAEIMRSERSYGPPPCAGAGGYSGGGSYAPMPQPQYLPPQPQPQSPLPQYREDEKHQESARSYYEPSLPALPTASGYGSGAASVLGPVPSPIPAHISGGPAVGLFPNAKVGGCNVPLLLSCSPQVVAGHLAESHYSAPAPAYRNGEEQEEAKLMEMTMQPPIARGAVSHHKVSEDYPDPKDPHPGNHHVVSKDYPVPNLSIMVQSQPLDIKKKTETKN